MSSSRSTCRSFPSPTSAAYAWKSTRCVPGQWWPTRASAAATRAVRWSANKATGGSSTALTASFSTPRTATSHLRASPMSPISCRGSSNILEVSGWVFIACCHWARGSVCSMTDDMSPLQSQNARKSMYRLAHYFATLPENSALSER